MNKNEVALIEYDKSIDTGKAIKDYYYTGMAYTNKGIVYSWDCVGQEELECTKKGYEMTKLSGDTVKIMYALHMYGVALIHNNLFDLANNELKEALELARSLKDTVSITKIKLNLAQNAVYGGDLTAGKTYYADAFQYDPKCFNGSDFGLWGKTSFRMNDPIEGTNCIEYMKFNLLSSIDTISWFEAMSEMAIYNNDYRLAVAYKDSIIKLSNIELEKTLSFNLIRKEKEFLTSEKDKYQLLSSQREKVLWLETISVIFTIVILLILFINLNNKKSFRIKRQKEELEKNRIILKNIRKSMEEKEETITSLEDMVKTFNHKLSDMDQYRT
ncbi:MAG: hypothetical protein K2L98_04440, partial [Bacilli bacterium]|nr:hypothetical protein [Bacilli bacterium]